METKTIADHFTCLMLTICYTCDRIVSLTVEVDDEDEDAIAFCESYPCAAGRGDAGFEVQSAGLNFFNNDCPDFGDPRFNVSHTLSDLMETLADTDAPFSVMPLSGEVGFVITYNK